jgi:hypothetical protein
VKIKAFQQQVLNRENLERRVRSHHHMAAESQRNVHQKG